MEFGTAVIVWLFLVFVWDWDEFWTGFVLFIIVIISLEDGGVNVSVNVDSTPTVQQEIVEPLKPKYESIPVTDFGNVKPEYLDNSKRSNDQVEVVKINKDVVACNVTNECFKPTIRKHLDGTVYACDTNKCYKVKQ